MDDIIDRLIECERGDFDLEPVLTELNDAIIWIPPDCYERTVPRIFNIFIGLLRGNRLDYKCKLLVVRVMNRLPVCDAIKNQVENLHSILINVFKCNSEEIGLVVLRIVVDWHKNFKHVLEAQIPHFLDLVQEMYVGIDNKVMGCKFNVKDGRECSIKTKQEVLAVRSFKVLSECPIIIVLFFQLYRRWMTEHIGRYISCFVSAVCKPIVELNICAGESKRIQYHEYILMLAKTLSFIVYVLRGIPNVMKPFKEQLPVAVLQLLKNCPNEASNVRKELLVATRHILSTDFRNSFIVYLEEFMEEKVVLGGGYTSSRTLRHILFSMLADLIYHIRMDLSYRLLDRTIQIYSNCLHDYTTSVNIQTMSAKLLLNMIDVINTDNVRVEERHGLLWRILSSYLLKLEVIANTIQKVGQNCQTFLSTAYLPDKIVHFQSLEMGYDPIRDIRFLIKTVIAGIRIILLNLRTNGMNVNVLDILLEESERFNRLFINGIQCFSLFKSEVAKRKPPQDCLDKEDYAPIQRHHISQMVSNEDREMLDQFSQIFTMLDSGTFHNVMFSQIGYFVESIIDNGMLISIAQYFLSINDVSRRFASIILRYLTDQLHRLGDSSVRETRTILHLYRLIFLSVSIFPDENEIVMQQFIGSLIMKCMNLSSGSKRPINYFYLLLSLFRSIGGGRFELLYKEVLPTLQSLLESLNFMINSTQNPRVQEVFVELSLTIPIRLSVLLPHLRLLMKPLVIALNETSELAIQGLRTLELCIDNLTQEFLNPILDPVVVDILKALWKHCQPLPYPIALSHPALRILGKLPSRVHKLRDELDEKRTVDMNSKIKFEFEICRLIGDTQKICKELSIPLMYLVERTIELWKNHEQISNDIRYAGFCIVSGLLIRGLGIEKGLVKRLEREFGVEYAIDFGMDDGRVVVQQELVPSIVKTMFMISACKYDVSEDSFRILTMIYQMIAAISILEKEEIEIDKDAMWIVFEELFETSSDDPVEVLSTKTRVLNYFMEQVVELAYRSRNAGDKGVNLMIFRQIASRLVSTCYSTDSRYQIYGCNGIRSICALEYNGYPIFDIEWYLDYEIQFLRCSIHVLKSGRSSVQDHPGEIISTIKSIMYLCHGKEGVKASDTQISHLVGLLTHELLNNGRRTRRVVQTILGYLASVVHASESALLNPFQDKLIGPIISKSLRGLPFVVQQNHVEVLGYCIELKPALVAFDDKLIGLIHDVIGICEAEDSGLIMQYKSIDMITSMKISCIEFLSSVVGSEGFIPLNQQGLRNRIITVFFKNLYATSVDIVNASEVALGRSINEQARLPKDLLQHGLRPILINLSEYKRLSVMGIESLGRLLQLLTNYFKVETGQKLLGHVKQAGESGGFSNNTFPISWINESIEVTLVSTIFNIFHLLPSDAHIFMDEVIQTIMHLERKIKRTSSSPFRTPILKYLVRYREHAVKHLMREDSLRDRERSGFFICVIGMDRSNEICRTTVEELESLIPIVKRTEDVLFIGHVVKICREVVGSIDTKDAADLISRLMFTIFEVFKNNSKFKSFKCEDYSLGMMILDYVETVLRCYQMNSTYGRRNNRIQMIWMIMDALERWKFIDIVSLKMHVKRCLNDMDLEFRRYLINTLLSSIVGRKSSEKLEILMVAIQVVVIPSIEISGTVDNSVVQSISDTLWCNEQLKSIDDRLLMELVDMSILLLERDSAGMVLKFEFGHNLREFAFRHYETTTDPLCKQNLNLLVGLIVSRTLNEREDLDVIQSVMTSCISCTNGEARSLIRRTTETIIYILEESPNIWMPPVEAILNDEVNAINYYINILNIVVSRPDRFYHYRRLFVPIITSCLGKLVIGSSGINDNKNLAIELIRLVIRWKIRKTEDEFEIPDFIVLNMLQMICRLLVLSTGGVVVNMTMLGRDRLFQSGIQMKCDEVYKQYLDYVMGLESPQECFNFSIFERQFVISVNETSGELVEEHIYPSLVFVDMLTQFVSRLDEMNQINFILNRCVPSLFNKLFMTGHPLIIYYMKPLIKMMYEGFLENCENSLAPPLESRFIEESLNRGSSLSCSLICIQTIMIIDSKASVLNNISSILPSLLKIPESLITQIQELLAKSGVSECDGMTNIKLTNLTSICITIFYVIRYLISRSSEFRGHLIQVLDSCIRPGLPNIILCYLVDCVSEWIRSETNTFNNKEKVMIISFCTRLINSSESRNLNTEQQSQVQRLSGVELVQISCDLKSIKHRIFDLIYLVYSTATYHKSELTASFENEFLMIWSDKFNSSDESEQVQYSEKFLKLLDGSLPKDVFTRLGYIFQVLNWDIVSDTYWINQALELLFSGCLDLASESNLNNHGRFVKWLILIVRSDSLASHQTWIHIFPQMIELICVHVHEFEFQKFQVGLTKFLKQEYHLRQRREQPNTISTLLESILIIYRDSMKSQNPISLIQPGLINLLSKNFGSWYSGMLYLEQLHSHGDDFRDLDYGTSFDPLADMYSNLMEHDMYFGYWKRRCFFAETNLGLSLEQHGYWEYAQTVYETIQTKARAGTLPQLASDENDGVYKEFHLWEDRWIESARKLQQWDILVEISKIGNRMDLGLEGSWRLVDWTSGKDQIEFKSSLEIVSEIPTPRRKLFEAFMWLSQVSTTGKGNDFHRLFEEGYQVSLQYWKNLPSTITNAHICTLYSFQQFVEIQESQPIYASLLNSSTYSRNNSDVQSGLLQELKGTLAAWRERLPNKWDDINIWGELFSWRHNVFSMMNLALMPNNEMKEIDSHNIRGMGSSGQFVYRGYQEMTWTNNKFAWIARKHGLRTLSSQILNRIYTTPNLDIQDVFLKIREQVKCCISDECRFFVPSHQNAMDQNRIRELEMLLENLNSTNLGYFTAMQRAELFVFKGEILFRLGSIEEASRMFSQAIQSEMSCKRGWAKWGEYNENRFHKTLENVRGDMGTDFMESVLGWASHAIHCYLQVAMLQKNKSSKYLARVLWMLSFDNESDVLGSAFETYSQNIPNDSWILLIPQLISSLSRPGAEHIKTLLVKIAKTHPQALFFQLRSISEDSNSNGTVEYENSESVSNLVYNDQIMFSLRNTHPFLILCIENMVECLIHRLRPTPDEDLYRIIYVILQETLQRKSSENENFKDGLQESLVKISGILSNPQHPSHKYKRKFDEDFLVHNLDLDEAVSRLESWKNMLEKMIESMPRRLNLEHFSHYLVEFEYQKYDEILIPGECQTKELSVKLERFHPIVEVVRRHGMSYRRVGMIGNDGVVRYFLIQNPAPRHARREERICQLFQFFNSSLDIESKSHNLNFNLPCIVPLSSHVRLIEGTNTTSLEDVLAEYCSDMDSRREPGRNVALDSIVAFYYRILRDEIMKLNDPNDGEHLLEVKLAVFDTICREMVPRDVLSMYVQKMCKSSLEYWSFRKEFSGQYAAQIALAYIMGISDRYLHRISFSASGSVTSSELFLSQGYRENSTEIVPFRLTPNIQEFVGSLSIDGILVPSIIRMSKVVSDSKMDVLDMLRLFIRDELVTNNISAVPFFEDVSIHLDGILERARELSCSREREFLYPILEKLRQLSTMSEEQFDQPYEILVPLNQTILEFVSSATDPQKLCRMNPCWHPWF